MKRRIGPFGGAMARLATLFPAAFAAGGGGGEQTPPTETPNYTISISTETLDMEAGDRETLRVNITEEGQDEPLSEIPDGMTITWESDDTTRVTVSPANNSMSTTVEARASAETTQRNVTITVRVKPQNGEELVDYCEVTVRPAQQAAVSVQPATLELAPGGTSILTATVTPSTADQAVTWTSSDNSVATVAEDGTVTAVAAGEATITATSAANGRTATCAVTVQGIVLADETVTVPERGNVQLGYQIFGESIEDNSVVWTVDSAGASFVRVNQGYVYGIAVGPAPATATVRGAG